jgi:restriction endonuclease S subunit
VLASSPSSDSSELWGNVGVLSNIEKSKDSTNLNNLRAVNVNRGLKSLGIYSTTPTLSDSLIALRWGKPTNYVTNSTHMVNTSSTT